MSKFDCAIVTALKFSKRIFYSKILHTKYISLIEKNFLGHNKFFKMLGKTRHNK